MYNLKKYYPEFINDNTLHMFSGFSDFGVTTDFRPETGASIIADYRNIPVGNNVFSNVLADPPYADHWQGQWHGDLPKPKHILREASRVVKLGGLIGILHIIIIPAYKELGVKRIGLHPILTGPNNAIRVFNVFRLVTQSGLEYDPDKIEVVGSNPTEPTRFIQLTMTDYIGP